MTTKSTSLRIAQITKSFYQTNPKKAKSRYLVTKSGLAICSRCCSMNQKRFALDDSWEIVGDRNNKLFQYLFCDNCNDRIFKLEG